MKTVDWLVLAYLVYPEWPRKLTIEWVTCIWSYLLLASWIMTKCPKLLLAIHHWCVCKFESHQCCDALSFPLSIARQHLVEKGELQSLHEVNGWSSQTPRIILRDVFRVAQVSLLSWMVYRFNLSRLKMEVVMLVTTSQGKIMPCIKIIVSTSACGEWSPSWPVCHNCSSSSSVNGSAWRFLAPIPSDCSCFISPSSVVWSSANATSLKKSILSRPLSCRWRRMPQQMWCKVFGGFSVPFFFRFLEQIDSSNIASCCYQGTWNLH